LAKQQDAAVQLGFEEPGLKFQRLAILGDAVGVAAQGAVGKGQVEVEAVVLGIGLDGFAEVLYGGIVAALVERLQPNGRASTTAMV
jgi:hypothetical protein